MLPSHLKADCSRCVALCCSSFSLSVDQGYPFEKSANERCRLLRDDHQCSIHQHRAMLGFAGCVAYDCYGAGQWVTQRFYGNERGVNALASDEVLDSFRTACAVHELLAILSLASAQAQNDSEREWLLAYERSIERLRESRSDTEVRRRIALHKQRVVAQLKKRSTAQKPGAVR